MPATEDAVAAKVDGSAIRSSEFGPSELGHAGQGRLGRRAGARFKARFAEFARLRVRFARFKAKFLSEHWNVGIIHASLESILEGRGHPPVEWLDDAHKDGFLADPFPFGDDEGRLTIFVEAYDYRTTKGSIAVLRYETEFRTVPNTTSAATPAATPGATLGPTPSATPAATLETHASALHAAQVVWHFPWHTSYPYLFEAEGNLYCVPETHQARQVTLYRARRYPDEWDKMAVLIEGFPAVDGTLFQFGDYWWLFCTDADGDADSQLHVWYADNLLGPWQPHCLNPVKSDVRSSRPAGRPFWRNGSLYRPSQDCSQTYGGRVVLNRIDCLTPTEFREVVVSAIEPPLNTPYSFGLHTLNSVGDLTIIDGKSYRFVPAYVWGELKQRILSKLRRMPGEIRFRAEHEAWYRHVPAGGKAPEPWRPE